MRKILGIGGSPRKGRNTDILIKEMLRGAKRDGAYIEELHLRHYQFQDCIGCEKCRKVGECAGLADGMQLIYPKIQQATGLVLISPIYSYNVTALTKAFIDRLYCYYIFGSKRPGEWSSRLAGQGRKAVIAAIGEQATSEEGGMDATLETMYRSIIALGYDVIEQFPVLGIFHKGRILQQPDILNKAERLGYRLAKSLPE
jgi:multimeric flavodoxin WrbA